ncbi:hypothetical protein [Tenacibaculum sp. 190130A14a]
MKKLISTLLILTILIGCNSLRKGTKSAISVAGSTWEYSDEDWTYQIEFVENGQIKSTHPNDNTPENDFWKQSHSNIHFEFNDGFSKYDGKMKSIDLITGIGKSTSGKWKWKMKKIK